MCVMCVWVLVEARAGVGTPPSSPPNRFCSGIVLVILCRQLRREPSFICYGLAVVTRNRLLQTGVHVSHCTSLFVNRCGRGGARRGGLILRTISYCAHALACFARASFVWWCVQICVRIFHLQVTDLSQADWREPCNVKSELTTVGGRRLLFVELSEAVQGAFSPCIVRWRLN